LPWLRTAAENAQAVCVYIKDGTNSVAKLSEAQRELGLTATSAKLSLAIRWNSDHVQSSWLLENKNAIQRLPDKLSELSSTGARANTDAVFKLVSSAAFWSGVAKANYFDSKFAAVTERMQGDDVTLSDVWCAIKELRFHLVDCVVQKIITKEQKNELIEALDSRIEKQGYRGLLELCIVADPRMVPGTRPNGSESYRTSFMPTAAEYGECITKAQECVAELKLFFELSDDEVTTAVDVLPYMEVRGIACQYEAHCLLNVGLPRRASCRVPSCQRTC
jgi:hypothetical protein